jgi:hypothetical protein
VVKSKNKLFKILSLLLTVIMFLSNFLFLSTVDAVISYTNLKYENGGMEFFDQNTYDSYKNNNQLPTNLKGGSVPRSIKIKENIYYLNYRLFVQKNLVVYGSYKSVAGNYFKCGYQIHNDLDEKQPDIYYDGGYFLRPDGVSCKGKEQNPKTHGDKCRINRGEWEYLGFDINGEAFSNMWMINVATETTFKERNWIKEPWSDKNEVKQNLSGRMSAYNEAAYNSFGRYPRQTVQYLKDWMFDTFSSVNGFSGIPDGKGNYDPNVYQYLYVQDAPSLQKAGSGKMWHVKPGGSIWYQTFSIPDLGRKIVDQAVVNTKKDLPVKCYVQAISPMPDIPEGSELDSQQVRLQFQVKGELQDYIILKEDEPAPADWVPYYKDSVTRTVYYTRQDIKSWELTLNQVSGITLSDMEKKPINIVPKNASDNTGIASLTVEATVGEIKKLPKKDGKYKIWVEATAKVIYLDGHACSSEGGNEFLTGKLPEPPEPSQETLVIDIPTLEIHNNIGEVAFDGVPFSYAADNTDMSKVESTELYVNGKPVEHDSFFSGLYVFPAVNNKNGYFAEVVCKYNLDKSKIILDGIPDEKRLEILNAAVVQYVSTDYVYVYPTKPVAQFRLSSSSWKQNRIINVENNSFEGNIQPVLGRYPITEYRWSYGGDISKLYKGTDNDFQKQLQYKQPGSYSLTLECKNSLGKWSDPFTVQFQVMEDISPNIEINLSESSLTRNDRLGAWHYDINSTDGDKISSARIELWYDSNNDGEAETKIQEWNGLGENGLCEPEDFPEYSPTQLGYYKYKVYARDEFVGVPGQETLVQYVTDADQKVENYEVEFQVDNYQPLSNIYVDAPTERPNVDLYIMRDKDLKQEKYEYMASNRVAMENALLGRNLIPGINIRDMKTYEYSFPASTTSNTNTTYPPQSIPFSSSGYSGTLQRTSVSDNGGYHDFGHYEQKTESRTASEGGRSTSGHGVSGSSPPSSVSYRDGEGYSGTLYGYGYVYSSVACSDKAGDFDWTRSYAGYSGTVTRTVSYWVPDVRWVANYTGYYSGTIFKYVSQPYVNPWRASSSKYLLYISDGSISELQDFNSVINKTDAKIILAGTPDIKQQWPEYDKYLDISGKSIQEIMNDVIEYISEDTSGIEQMYILQNQSFTLKVSEDDLENDEIILKEMQYVHHKDYFDNPTGKEQGTQTVPDNDIGWTDEVRSSFSNVGKYQIFRRVKDKPTGEYGDSCSYYSGSAEVDLYVHRKPIAAAELDWDFDSGTNTYKTNWVDKSYDLDHNITRADTDKGIVQRKIMWRKDGGDWNYTIPDRLSPGTYNLRYYVEDMENAWSDVFTINLDGTTCLDVPEVTFTLSPSPPMQFRAKLRAAKQQFRIPPSPITIPAGEDLEIFDIWTRYPQDPELAFSLYNGGSLLQSVKTVKLNSSTGIKTGNDIQWNNIIFNISNTTMDGNYTLKITALEKEIKTISFPVTLKTPIDLEGYINGKSRDSEINTGNINIFKFTTSKYVTSVSLQFEGRTYSSSDNQIKLVSTDGTTKTWTYTADIQDGAYAEGRTGIAKFFAYLPSGMSENTAVDYRFTGLKAENFQITMMLDIGWRSYYFNLNSGIDDNHDGMADRYPRRSNTDIGTQKLPVNYYSLVGHSRTYIKAGYKVKGRIDIQGNPDSAYFIASYYEKGKTEKTRVNLIKSSGNTYTFQWIIPLNTDPLSFVSFDLVTAKGTSTYGNEKWIDKWDRRNTERRIFYVNGNAYDDLNFVQSH